MKIEVTTGVCGDGGGGDGGEALLEGALNRDVEEARQVR